MVNKVNAPKSDDKAVVSTHEKFVDPIWAEIKDLKLDLFGLNGLFVKDYYKPFMSENGKCFLSALTKAGAAFPALEEAVKAKFDVTRTEKFIVVSFKSEV